MRTILRPPRSAREELAATTHERVMIALAAVLRADAEVTFDVLARASGVPVRTLYRYFPSKEALFAAFWPWMNERIEVPARPRTADEVISHIPELFAAFDRDEMLVRAMLHSPHGRQVRIANAAARREKFADALREVTTTLSPAATRRFLAAVTAICSASGWESMKDNWGLSGPAAAEAAQWAVHALINEARGRARIRNRSATSRS
jgi:AcrR family transcriptional regulator